MNLRVWHLCSNRWNSAITEYALRSAQSLALRGLVSEISALPGSPCAQRAEALGIGGPSYRFALADLMALRRRVKSFKPAFIFTYGGPETFLARFLGVPVIRFRGQDRDLSQPLSKLELRMNLGFCRAALVPAETMAKRFQDAMPQLTVRAVMLGLDSAVFHDSPWNPGSRPTLLIVGRLDPIKGHREFLAVFSRLLSEWQGSCPRPLLKIIGQASNVSPFELRAEALRLGLEEGCDWCLDETRALDLPRQMSEATLGIIPSLGSEVIGRVAEEFLLTGTPIAISGVGTLSECLRDDSFGINLLGMDPVPALKTWIQRAFSESQAVRSQRAKAARETFSLEAMGQALETFLKNL